MTPSTLRHTLRHYFTHGLFPQLRVFEACARLGSFSRAAEELCVAQPTVSCQMRKLNETVGMPLFDMTGKKVSLTQAGRELQVLCSGVFDQFIRFDQSIAALNRPLSPTLRVAVTTGNQYMMACALGHFAEQGEDRQVVAQIMNRRQLCESLYERKHDVYIVEDLPAPEGFDATEICGHELAVLAPRNHRLAAHERIALSELTEEFWILREEGSGTRDTVLAHFADSGFLPRVRITLGSNDAIRAALLDGAGIGVLPLSMFRAGPESEGLVRLHVDNFPLQQRCFALVPHHVGAIAEVASLVAALTTRMKLPNAKH